MSTPFYITTPIYYVNARPHIGHAYTTIVADAQCRFNKMRGADTFFLTGTDEHGDKIMRAAKKEDLSPRAYVDKISAMFKNLWPELNIEYDYFVRTTDPAHIAVVEQILQRIYDSGDIYFSEYEGQYCFGCERFYTDRELVDGKCPDHETTPEIIKESNYFFKMGKYQGWLIDHIRDNPDFIRPERYKNEVLAFLREPLEDLCISRPKKRLKWGITLPFDDEYVTYVWFDALLNYVSALGYPDGEKFKKYWPSVQHVVAKDILKPHGIYWPIILKAAGIPVYNHLNVHGYWNLDRMKVSKSLGNVVDPIQLKNVYGLDAFRYFLIREMVFGLDSTFSEEAMAQRYKSDLADDLGNLIHRVMAMTHKYFKGVVPENDDAVQQELAKCDAIDLKSEAIKAVCEFEKCMSEFGFHKALMAVWEYIQKMNKYVDVTAPWELAKKKTTQKELRSVIYQLLEGLRVVSGMLYPIMPDTAMAMQRHLGLEPNQETENAFFRLDALKTWGVLKAGSKVPKSAPLFPKIEEKTEAATDTGDKSEEETGLPDIKPEIDYETFSKLDLRVATVIRAERIPKAKKLLRVEVDMGEKRTIVAGIAEKYEPDDLVGKQVIVVANLKPATLMGVQSRGMILAAVGKTGLCIASPEKKADPGTPVR